jgi:diketogulonate reductase-like aldo/keto reductase
MTILEQPTIPTRTAHDGLELPAVGFGTWLVNGKQGYEAVKSAIGVGYRLIDSAFNYENEGIVGRAIRESGVPREQILVTSKLPGRHHHYEEAKRTIEESVARMGLDYIDLYLIHWPNPSKGLYVEAWQAMIDAQKEGLLKHIGVSNFMPGHIDTLTRLTGVTPAVNQVETHPYFQQKEQRAYDDAHGIITEAWSPLGRASQMLKDPTILKIAQKHSITPVQTVLRWHLQIGTVAIPKSMNRERQMANIHLNEFELDSQDMTDIDAMDNPEGRLAAQDPRHYEEF